MAGLVNVEGGFEYLVTYTAVPEEGTKITPGITIGTTSVYVPVEYPYGPVPADIPMAVNKWSGYSTAPTNANTAKSLKLQSWAYNFQWIKPAEGQVFAHWFIELNNWQGENAPEKIGQNIVITDTMQGIANFTPQVLAAEDGALTQAQLDEQLNGTYLQNFVSVAVRENGDTETYPTLNNLGQTLPFITFTTQADGATTMTFRVSDYLASIDVTPSDMAQYAINYYTVIPEKSANITNYAEMTSTEVIEPATDTGWYKYVDAAGWARGDQPLTSLTVTKKWGEGTTEIPLFRRPLMAAGASKYSRMPPSAIRVSTFSPSPLA